ncbi:GIY-YIG nuclease superfamily protein [compost metagenome]
MERGGCVYIMTNVFNTVFYIGVTSNLFSRVTEHKEQLYPNSFTAKYNCNKLVYSCFYTTITEAIAEEKRIKKWNRDWKINLIIKDNPHFKDLYSEDL